MPSDPTVLMTTRWSILWRSLDVVFTVGMAVDLVLTPDHAPWRKALYLFCVVSGAFRISGWSEPLRARLARMAREHANA